METGSAIDNTEGSAGRSSSRGLIEPLLRLIERRPALTLAFAALLTRAAFVWRAPPSFDETRTLELAARLLGPGRWIELLAFDNQAPLYPLLTSFLVGGFGAGIDSLRWFSVMASTLTVPILYDVYRQWLRPRGALVAGLATVCSPFLIFYGKEARPYALLGLLFAIFLWVAVRWDRGRFGIRAFLTLPFLAVAFVGTHYLAVLSLAAFFLVAARQALLMKDLARLLRTVGVGALAAAVCAPLGLLFFLQVVPASQGFPYWEYSAITSMALLVEQVYWVAGNSLPAGDASFVLFVLHGVLLVLLAVPVIGEVGARRGEGRSLDPLVVWLWWLPVAFLFLASLALGRSYLYYPRFLIPVAPMVLMIWALGTARMMRRAGWRRRFAQVTVLLFLVLSVLVTTSSRLHPDFAPRGLVADFRRQLAGRLQPGDTVLVHHPILTSYIAHGFPGPQEVVPLGDVPLAADAEWRLGAITNQLDKGLARGRMVVVENALAEHGGLGFRVRDLLDRKLTLVNRLPCWNDDPGAPGTEVPLLCTAIYVYERRR